MLQTFMHVLNAQRIVLASGSPRRKVLLENVGLQFEVIPSTFEENVDKCQFSSPPEYVLETARLKLEEVASRLSKTKNPVPDLLIGADTVIFQDSRIIEKPKDKEDHVSILSSLSGKTHHVYTGVILACPADSNVSIPSDNHLCGGLFHYTSFVECTEVFMTHMTPDVIQGYVDTGEGMDKAGGYGLQALGGTLIEKIHGDYNNVIGFPLSRFCKELFLIYKEKSLCS